MTLSRQLILLVSLLVVLLFLGTFFISAYNTRDYLETQLASHSQDAATSLGLSATTHVAEKDKAIVSSMVNAMIHRGDYRLIRIEDLKGNAWIERKSELGNGGVPDWFVSMFELKPPSGTATMMSGWRQVGKVRVVSHPGLAYQKLWTTSRDMLSWFVIGAVLVLLIGLVALRIMLRPLKDVEWQADSICNREFPIVEQRPFTVEFRRVVEAMNRLSSKVCQMLTESERLASRLREQAYQDPVTGLANRRQFMDVLAHRIDDVDALHSGGILLLQLNDFKAYNQQYGYPAGDHLLAKTADLLRTETADMAKVTTAHLAGADFAILAEDIGTSELESLAVNVADAMSSIYAELELPSADVAHVGGITYAGQSLSDLMSEADLALRQAQTEGANAWVVKVSDDSSQASRTASDWFALIDSAIQQRSFTLLKQPIYSTQGKILLHEEIFLRLIDPDDVENAISAGVFMPMAENAGLAHQIDRAVLSLMVDQLMTAEHKHKSAVNMSPASLTEESMLDWVFDLLSVQRGVASQLILEWPEYGATAHVSQLRNWIEKLAPLGVQFSLDHFGKGFSSFAYLRELKADYLKVDGSYLQSLEKNPDNQFFLQAMGEIAHGLDMQVIAESVETEEVWLQLPALGVDGARGYWLGAPS